MTCRTVQAPPGGHRGRRRRQPHDARRLRRRPRAGTRCDGHRVGTPARSPRTRRRQDHRLLAPGSADPGDEGPLRGRAGTTASSKGYEVIVQDPKLDPQKQVTDLQSRHRERRAPPAPGRSPSPPPSMTALVADRPRQGRPADPQRHPRGLRPGRPRARASRSRPSTTRPRARRSARSSATASTSGSTARPRSSSRSPPRAPPARRSSRPPSRRRSPPPPPTPRSSPPSSSATAPPRRPTSATPSRATPTSPPSRPERRGRARRHRRLQGRRQGAALPHRGRRQRRGPRRGRGRRHLRRRGPAVRGRHGAVLRHPGRDDRRPEAEGVQLTVPQEVVKAEG